MKTKTRLSWFISTYQTEFLQDLTSSRKKLQDALAQLELPQQPQQRGSYGGRGGGGGGYPGGGGGGGGNPGGGGGRGHRGGGTVLYDAVLLASNEIMKKQSGRKALILLTDGVDNGSKTPLSQSIEAAQRSDTLVYSILFADEEGYGGFNGPMLGGHGRGGMGRMPAQRRPDGKKVLQQISQETGASFFEVSKKQPIEKVFSTIDEELRNQYSLGYTSDRTGHDPGFRRISLTTWDKGLIVQSRDGYYAES